MIQLKNVEKSYPTGPTQTWVLRQITLDIPQGDFVTIMGPSGAGKSTLLAILGMLDHSWQGEYDFLDEAVHKMKPRDRVELNKRYIGFVFQQYHLLDDLTVYENLDIPLSYRDVKKAERAASVAETLDRFNIVAFSTEVRTFRPELVSNTRAAVRSGEEVVAGVSANGGTKLN